MERLIFVCVLQLGLLSGVPLLAQESPAETPNEATESQPAEAPRDISRQVGQATDYVGEQTEQLRQQLDSSEQAQQYSAGILQPIYLLAGYLSFSSFHWIAFATMMSGFISFAMQLVLGKLAILLRGGFSLAEILSDVQGLVISLFGLVLLTQVATEHSAFTSSAAAVLSATVVGVLAGVLFYVWGQRAEIEALKGRKLEQVQAKI